MSLAQLGVCYFPEHWPREEWPAQARAIADLGITLVRIGEFAWARTEPARGEFDWEWLDTAIDTLGTAGLQVILCTPTACPPKWLVDEMPSILPADEFGRPRGFGSRRHYRFASVAYRAEAQRITAALVERYGSHPAVVGWQLDNEYGCHETTVSYSEEDRMAFQDWLRGRFGSITDLNEAWGAMFWSQNYHGFGAVELSAATVTEANPAQRMDYRRFASEQVVTFNRDQAALIREGSPGRWLTHNFMGNFVEFDHFDVGADLDVASWDSYPLGFLDQGWFSEDEKQRYRRIGHPDWAAFHHDLYRAVGRGRTAVMEQQPGPVNWAAANAQPVPGAVAYWSMEAIAHGAEFVSYFRFRQYPRAQEQMHAALQLPDGSPAPAAAEVQRLAAELTTLPEAATTQAPVAVLFDYPSCWSSEIQPHAPQMHALPLAFEYYRALRSLGQDVDIVSGRDSLDGYALIVAPAAHFLDAAAVERLRDSGAAVIFGPRSASRDEHFAVPPELAPGALQALLPLRVIAVDSMRPGSERRLQFDGEAIAISRWYEDVDTALRPVLDGGDEGRFWYRSDRYHYLNGWIDHGALQRVFARVLGERDVTARVLPEGLRLRNRGPLQFVFNAGPDTQHHAPAGQRCLLGDATLEPASYAVWTSP